MNRSIVRPVIIGVLLGLVAYAALASTAAMASHGYPPAFHWGEGSQPRAFVTIEDYTPAEWPVLAATTEWATAQNLDVYYNSGSCGSTGHCVDVRLQTFSASCNTTRGLTSSFATDHLLQTTKVRVNSKCGASQFTNRDRRSVACHELGHVMGLDEETSLPVSESCMVNVQGASWVNRTEHPGTHDISLVASRHNHNH